MTAVLALPEPYRRTLLLYYYDDQSAAAIAAQMGVPAGTVRSRITRALQLLRRDLDNQRPEGRSAWLPGLLAIADRGRVVAGGWLLASVGAFAATFGVAVLWMTRSEPTAPATTAAIAAPVIAAAPAPQVASATAQDPPPASTRAEAPTNSPSMGAMTLADVEVTAGWIQYLLRQHLLFAAPADVGAELRALASVPDVGATRVLRRELAEFRWNNALGVRGGGAYFSFATNSHSYDDQPDLGLENGDYGCTFYGGTAALMMPLDDVPLTAIQAQLPAALATDQRSAWEHMWVAGGERGIDDAWQRRGAELGLVDRCRARPGHSYLLRRSAPREHDVLVAFRCISSNEDGHTIVYRVLRTFVASESAAAGMPAAPLGQPPAWLRDRSVPSLLALLAELRALTEPRLLAVPADVVAAWTSVLGQPDTGATRILARGRFAAVVQSREGAAHFDFIDGSHAYGSGTHLGLESGHLNSAFAGADSGFLLDLGPTPLTTVHAFAEADAAQNARFKFVLELKPRRDEHGALRVAAADAEQAHAFGITARAPAVASHTYLLRAVRDDNTLVVAFTVVQLDRDGCTLVWRMLERTGR